MSDGPEASVWRSVQAAGLGRWDHDLVTGVRFWDARNRAIFGLRDQEASPPDRAAFLALVHPDDRKRLAREMDHAMSDPLYGPFGQRYRVLWAGAGEERWMASYGRAGFEGGRCVRFSGVTQDVTEQHRMEAALRRMNETLEAQVAARTGERDGMWLLSQDMMVVLDAAGHVQAANPAWLPVLGRSEETVRQSGPFELLHPDDRARAEAAIRGLTAKEVLRPSEVRMCHADGGYRVISWAAASRGDIIYAVGRDVTAHHEAALALARTQDALRQAQKMEAVGQLTGGLAHDFNNLLTGIIGGLALIKRRIAAGRVTDLDRFIDAATASASRAASLTHRLLAFSRRQTLDPQTVDIGRLVGSLVEQIGQTAGPGITLRWHAQEKLWPACCDADQLESALLTLAINARDAMPNGGTLTITCRNAPADPALDAADRAEIMVSDTGMGMTPDTLDRVFEPFFTTKPAGHGTGLGLSMVYGFVRQSGGQVSIESAPGQGATVRLLLPRADHAATVSAAASGGKGEATVLVVDDEPAVRLTVAEALRERGYAVSEAADAATALHMLQHGVPAAILVSDVRLPGGMTGRQLAEAARVLRPSLRVLLITGYSEQGGDELRQGGVEVLTKPFALDVLTARVAAL